MSAAAAAAEARAVWVVCWAATGQQVAWAALAEEAAGWVAAQEAEASLVAGGAVGGPAEAVPAVRA